MHNPEPIQSIIWHCLDHYDFKNAIFLAERLFAENETDETIFLLATSYYRAKQVPQAYWLLKKKSSRAPRCRYLQALCAFELKNYTAAEQVFTSYNEVENFDDVTKDFGDLACFVLQLMGKIYRKSERISLASKALRQALKLNPFMWQAYVELCNMGENVDAKDIFQLNDISSLELKQCQCRYFEATKDKNATLEDVSKKSFYTPKNNVNIACNAICHQCSTPFTDESLHVKRGEEIDESGFALLTEQFNSLTSISPVTLKTVNEQHVSENENKISAVSGGYGGGDQVATKALPIPTFKVNETQFQIGAKPNVFTPAGNTPFRQTIKAPLLSLETLSAKENKNSTASLSKWSPRKPKYRFTKEIRLEESDEEGLLKFAEKSNEAKNLPTNLKDSSKLSFEQVKSTPAENFLALLIDFGIGYKFLTSYQCKKAILHFELKSSENQLNSSFLQSLIAKCHYELQNYDEAARIFKKIHESEPCRFEFMDIYSSCLWQLQQPIELSTLAQDLINCDRLSAISWCVAGNCFSLQSDHTTAIKLMQRSVQVDADFAYGYTLLGYEHVYHEDLDEARSCFAAAIARDSRHYNALFGIGTTYAKQQKHQTAEFYFRKALRINPNNSVILVHIAVMQHAQQNYQQALMTLNAATKINPQNLIGKLQRARVCFALKRYEQALKQLEELKNMAPKESIVFQLLGNVHQAMGHNEMALMYFSWSMDMESKKAEPFTPVLPKRWL